MEDIPRNALYACGGFFMGGRMNRIIDSFRQLCLEGKKEQETDFFREVQNGIYWIPVKYDSKEDMHLQICMIQSARGRKYIPAFLDREGCRAKMKLMKINYPRLKELTEHQRETVCGLVIDPYGEKIVIDRTLMHLMEKQKPAEGERNAV